MRRRQQRGLSLAWALLTVLAVTTALSIVAGSLTRRARLIQHFRVTEVRADLVQSGRTLAELRTRRDSGWTGPERLELDTGAVTVQRSSAGVQLVLELPFRDDEQVILAE
ncbi:MAG: hypothetical protein AAF533_02470 [Acidobacteriota bacterium]